MTSMTKALPQAGGQREVTRSGERTRRSSGLPRWILAPAAVGALFVALPLVAMIVRLDWSRFGALIASESSVAALQLSLETSASAATICLLVGVPLAMVLARTEFPGQQLVRALVLLPLVLPPVVGGIALLYAFGRRGLLAPVLSFFGITIAFSTAAVVLAQTFVALPFFVVSLEGTLRTMGQRYEQVAATLGARPFAVLFRVTLPLVLPGLASATILAFARALGEFGATITFAGSMQGITRTLPLEIYLQSATDPDAASALSLVLVAVAILVTALTARLAEAQPR